MINVREFEDQVWEIEGVRLVVHAPNDTLVEPYTYQNATASGTNVTKWIENRVSPCINDHTVMVVQGNGEQPHGRTLIRNVRSYYQE